LNQEGGTLRAAERLPAPKTETPERLTLLGHFGAQIMRVYSPVA